MSTEMSTTLSRVCRWNCREGTVRMLESALGVWMTSWLVVPRPSPTVVRVYSNSCSSLPPSATKKKYPLMTPLWHHSEEIKYRTYNYGSVIHVLSRSILWPNFHRRFLILLSWIPALQVSLTTRVSATGAAVFCLPCLLVGSLIPPQPPLHPITSNHASPTSQTKIYAFKWLKF